MYVCIYISQEHILKWSSLLYECVYVYVTVCEKYTSFYLALFVSRVRIPGVWHFHRKLLLCLSLLRMGTRIANAWIFLDKRRS